MQGVPVGVIPFGTGNDLYRVLSELGGNSKCICFYFPICPDCPPMILIYLTGRPSCLTIPDVNNPYPFFDQFCRPKEAMLDLWNITCEALEGSDSEEHIEQTVETAKATPRKPLHSGSDSTGLGLVSSVKVSAKKKIAKIAKYLEKYPEKTMNNYFGIGVDGHVSLIFDDMRKAYPHLFFSKFVNIFWYMLVSIFYMFFQKQTDLSKVIEMECDGKKIEIPAGTQGIIVLNINSYAGGSKIWRFQGLSKTLKGDSGRWKPALMSDRILEVVAVLFVAFNLLRFTFINVYEGCGCYWHCSPGPDQGRYCQRNSTCARLLYRI